MPATKDKVMEMVEKELKKNPDISNEKLLEKAAKVDSSIEKLTLRQFHARYPLQVKRRMASGKKKSGSKRKRGRKGGGKRGGAGAEEQARDALREVLLRFAKDVSAAEGKAETIDVLTSVESYVEDALKAVDRR